MEIRTKRGRVLTEKDIVRLAEAAERGDYPGKATGEIQVGRPLMFGEELRPVTFKETERKIAEIDRKAASLNMTRSDYLRFLVDRDLATA